MLSKCKRLERRKLRSKKNIRVSEDRPRLTVFRSSRYLYAQVIDMSNNVLVSFSSLSKGIDGLSNNVASAAVIGTQVGEQLKKLNITKVVFDRNGYVYHGRVRALAEACRAVGIDF